MNTDDYSQVLDIWLRASIAAHDFVPAAIWHAQLDAMREIYLPGATSLVQVRDGRVVGFVSMMGDHLAALFVNPAQQGGGIGRALLEAACRDRPVVELDVYAKNTRATAFYRRQGFEETGHGIDPVTGERQLQLRRVR